MCPRMAKTLKNPKMRGLWSNLLPADLDLVLHGEHVEDLPVGELAAPRPVKPGESHTVDPSAASLPRSFLNLLD